MTNMSDSDYSFHNGRYHLGHFECIEAMHINGATVFSIFDDFGRNSAMKVLWLKTKTKISRSLDLLWKTELGPAYVYFE